MDAAAFFGRLAGLMVDNPPPEADAPALERFAAIGLARGRSRRAGPADALDEGVRRAYGAQGRRRPVERTPAGRCTPGGAPTGRITGSAFVALVGLGANMTEDSIYPHTAGRSRAAPGRRELLRASLRAGRTPPARAFWSLTMYDEHQYFVDNPLDRYAIGDRDSLAFEPRRHARHRSSARRPARTGVELAARARRPLQRDPPHLLAGRGRVAGGWMPPAVEKSV